MATNVCANKYISGHRLMISTKNKWFSSCNSVLKSVPSSQKSDLENLTGQVTGLSP